MIWGMSLTITPRLPAGTPNPDTFWGEGEFGPLVSLNYSDAITLMYLLRDDDSIMSARSGGMTGAGTVDDLTMRVFRALDWLLGVEKHFRGGRGVLPSFGVRIPVSQSAESDITHKVYVLDAHVLLIRMLDFLRECRAGGVGQVWWS